MAGSMELPAKGGFSFDLCRRNAMLEKNGLKMPGFRKTGTTIVGLVFQVSCDLTFTVSIAFQGSDGALSCWKKKSTQLLFSDLSAH
jgi:hypothetical protein